MKLRLDPKIVAGRIHCVGLASSCAGCARGVSQGRRWAPTMPICSSARDNVPGTPVPTISKRAGSNQIFLSFVELQREIVVDLCRSPGSKAKPSGLAGLLLPHLAPALRGRFAPPEERNPVMSLKNHLIGALVAFAMTAGAANAQVVVSSKIDTEGGVLGNIILLVLNANGIADNRPIQLGGTPVCARRSPPARSTSIPNTPAMARSSSRRPTIPLWKDAAKGYRDRQEARLRRQQDRLAVAVARQQHLGHRGAQGRRRGQQAQDAVATSANTSPAAAR